MSCEIYRATVHKSHNFQVHQEASVRLIILHLCLSCPA